MIAGRMNGNGRANLPRLPIVETANVAEEFGQLRADYNAAKGSLYQRPRSGLPALGAGADYHFRTESEYYRTNETILDMARNDSVVSVMLERVLQNVLQDGFVSEPATGDDALNAELKARFEAWARDPDAVDASGRFTLHNLAYLAGWSEMATGDAFLLPLADGRVEFIEGYRCRSPNNYGGKGIVLGVEIDERRRPFRYWFTPDDIDPRFSQANASKADPYAARDEDGEPLVWHVADPRRFTQTRGVSAFLPTLVRLGLLDDSEFAKLVKQQISACLVFFTERPVDWQGGTDATLGSKTETTHPSGEAKSEQRLSPGIHLHGLPGEKLQAFAPSIVTADDQAFIDGVLRMIAAAIDLPLIALLLDGRETNFSGWRGAIDQARIGWKRRQRRYAELIYRRAYRWRMLREVALDDGLARRAAALGDRFYDVAFRLPRWPYIEPVKDITAAGLERKTLLVSPRRQAAERGAYEWRDVVAETVEDNAIAVRAAITRARAIETETGVVVDPAQLLYLDASKPIALAGMIRTPEPAALPAPAETAIVESDQAANTETEQAAPTAAPRVAPEDLENYAAAVRSGAVTPQSDDESQWRTRLGLPEMNEQTRTVWERTGRRPVTLSSFPNEPDAPSPNGEPENVEDGGNNDGGGADDNQDGNGEGDQVGEVAHDQTPTRPRAADAHFPRIRPALAGTIPHVGQYLGPWLIAENAHRELVSLAESVDIAAHVREYAARAQVAEDVEVADSYLTTSAGRIAIVEIIGPTTKFGSSLFDGTSTIRTRRSLRKAASDPRVEAIVLLIDSPGGTVQGTGDLADDVYRIDREAKPIVTFAEDTLTSAAYWVASQSRRIVANPSTRVGSIGVVGALVDMSEYERKLGLKTYVIRSSEFKALGQPGEEITDEFIAEARREVADVHALFVSAIARGRGVSDSAVGAWADGRVHLAAAAQSLGMIDEVGTFDELITSLERGGVVANSGGAIQNGV